MQLIEAEEILKEDYSLIQDYLGGINESFWQKNLFPLLFIAMGKDGPDIYLRAGIFRSFYLMLVVHNDLPGEGIERPQAILSGDYLFGHALKLLAKDKKLSLLNPLAGILTGNIEAYCRGKDHLVLDKKAELAALALKTAGRRQWLL